ncbi:MAG TPA: type II toxin-antitoxin system HicB family antitoxin [Dehalococcoidia bacterium]|nr:type II toxin-antitoxin system HicB family antitoxin [Dehalococcoidia bacterium]
MNGREYKLTHLLEPDPEEGGYTVTVPALPGIVTQGETVEEAIEMGRDALRCHVKGLLKDGETVPTEGEGPRVVTVVVAA